MKNHTFRIARRADALVVHFVPEDATALAELFGGETGDEIDKFARVEWRPGPSGAPILTPLENWFAGRILERHADDFRNRVGFTYTVLERINREVIGCVYIYPVPDNESDARVLSWVRADRAGLDAKLWRVVSDWIEADWPFATVEYAARN